MTRSMFCRDCRSKSFRQYIISTWFTGTYMPSTTSFIWGERHPLLRLLLLIHHKLIFWFANTVVALTTLMELFAFETMVYKE